MKRTILELIGCIALLNTLTACGPSRIAKQHGAIYYADVGAGKYNVWDYDGAIAEFNIAIEMDSTYVPAYYFRGNAYSGRRSSTVRSPTMVR